MTYKENIESNTLTSLTLTSTAANAVKTLLKNRELNGYALRIFIKGGGCSGFQYGMALDENIREEDTVIKEHDVTVVIDEVSINYLHGATIDYLEDPMGSGFKIDNPNTMSSCGCGSSSQTKENGGLHGGCSGCG